MLACPHQGRGALDEIERLLSVGAYRIANRGAAVQGCDRRRQRDSDEFVLELCGAIGCALLVDAGADDDELVAAASVQTCCKLAWSKRPFDRRGNCAQELVAVLVREVIVHRAQPIEVEEEERQRLSFGLMACEVGKERAAV